jgi:RNA polymerase sigma-70 factor (ECF subfamily)
MLNGDEAALKTLLNQYHNYLMVVGMRYLSDKQRVEDVIHDVFADLWNKQKEITIHAGVKSFLRGAVVNKCLAIIRKDSRMVYLEHHNTNIADQVPTAEQNIDRDNLSKTISTVVDGLHDRCREVFILSRYEGKSHKEISEEMGISKKTIENHMTRALKTIKTELKRQELIIIVFIVITMVFQ